MNEHPAKLSWRVIREWSIQDAGYTYAVYRRAEWGDEEVTVSQVATGDLEWATKNADHLGVEIEDE